MFQTWSRAGLGIILDNELQRGQSRLQRVDIVNMKCQLKACSMRLECVSVQFFLRWMIVACAFIKGYLGAADTKLAVSGAGVKASFLEIFCTASLPINMCYTRS